MFWLKKKPKESSVCDERGARTALAKEVLVLVQDVRGRVEDRVQRAMELTETEVIAVGGCLSTIVDDGRSQVRETERVLGQVSEESGISSAIETQSRTVAGFVDTLSTSLQEHHDLAKSAHDQSSRILEAGNQIHAIAHDARILNVNAQIEAARLGDAGRSLAVIAQQMRELTQAIEAANTLVSELADGLAACMPKLASGSRELVDSSQVFAQDFERGAREIEQAQTQLAAGVQDALHKSEARSERILTTAQMALSHLQFQDAMAQSLRQVVGSVKAVEQAVADQADGVGGTIDPAAALVDHRVADPSAPPVSRDPMMAAMVREGLAANTQPEIGTTTDGDTTADDPGVAAAASGDILLF